ncbi:hypothetical protein A2480_02885 [Candidatus Uhrbacteria bacterium RIFOXYC2_FULL_47_19]|uniref:Uncharacterized protein n=1 Tax=Candidatus Uhrbacteria bacterium RIFOXYC2_FULL_47_19 TaxID=1802424 RepID=A0A1F7WE30_9BACT|nr:MAG: hypothetical protein A2480_02885 [Candidatus Uhrbacteria bacterium RIFOXYC2_FULL_47_19]
MNFVNGSSLVPTNFVGSKGERKIEQLKKLLKQLISSDSWLKRLGIIEREKAAKLLGNSLQHFQPGQPHGDHFYRLIDGKNGDLIIKVIFTVTKLHQTVLGGEDSGEPIAVLLVHLMSNNRCVGYRAIYVHADGRVIDVHYDPTNAHLSDNLIRVE